MTFMNEQLHHTVFLYEMGKSRHARICKITELLRNIEDLQRLSALFSDESEGKKYFQQLIVDTQHKINQEVDELLTQEKQVKDYVTQNKDDLKPDDVQCILKSDAFLSIFKEFAGY